MNRRKFLSYVGCGCCGLMLIHVVVLLSQKEDNLKLFPEAKLNAQAAQIYEKIKEERKTKQ